MKVQLDNADFVSRAPAQLIEQQKIRLNQTEAELASTLNKLALYM